MFGFRQDRTGQDKTGKEGGGARVGLEGRVCVVLNLRFRVVLFMCLVVCSQMSNLCVIHTYSINVEDGTVIGDCYLFIGLTYPRVIPVP